jgi:hypothetical protein
MTTRERLLYLADNIAAHGDNITYPSRVAAREVRNIVLELAAALRSSSPASTRKAIRELAIKQHVRAAAGGGFVNNGRSCALCKGEWADDAPERHGPACPADLGTVAPRDGKLAAHGDYHDGERT